MVFGGRFDYTLDAKKRLFVPAKYREGLGESFVICKAPECALFAYSVEEWEKICEQINASDDRDMQRLIYEDVVNVEIDKQGRITLKKELCEYAHLTKEVVIAGVGRRVEIWDKAVREEHMSKARENKQEAPAIHY